MSLLCSGRVAIVTGAGRGIGREHALALAAHGAKVVVNDLGTSNDGVGSDETPAQEVVRTIKERGGEAVVNTDNVADFRGAKRMIDQAIDTYGTLDVLVNNAGILRDRVLVNMVEPEWDAVIEVHLKGTFAPSRHASAYWRNKSKEIDGPVNARIINTSSISGLFGNTGQANYGAAKAGIAAFTIIAARELQRYGVTVNAVAPQALTRMTEGLRERTEEQKAAMHPGRVSPAIVWMASVEILGLHRPHHRSGQRSPVHRRGLAPRPHRRARRRPIQARADPDGPAGPCPEERGDGRRRPGLTRS